MGSLAIAQGQDYKNFSPIHQAPISGHCYGPEPGRLSSHQHMRRLAP